MNTWLVFNYKVPYEPSARRVFVWRKLKSMGAIAVQDASWVLPANARTREKMQWLANEVQQMGGEAILWEATQLFTGQTVNLAQQFTAQVDVLYTRILQKLDQDEADLTALSREYQQTSLQDYFQSELGVRVRAALLDRRRNGEP